MTSLKGIAVTLIMAGLLLSGGTYLLRNAPAALRWDRAEGTIMGHAVEIMEANDEPLYWTVITYSYRVGGIPYLGTRLPGGRSRRTGSERDARLIGDYPVGSTVAVLYDERDPGKAVVGKGMSLLVLALMTIGGYLAVLGVMLVVYGYFRGM